jgi:hypothetical protein
MSSISIARTLGLISTPGSIDKGVKENVRQSAQKPTLLPSDLLRVLQNPGRPFLPPVQIKPDPPVRNLSTDQQKLDQAEQLAQDAFRRISNPQASIMDRLLAMQEMQRASQLRKSVVGDLPKAMQQEISQVEALEENAFRKASDPHGSIANKLVAQQEMQQGAQVMQKVDEDFHIPSHLRDPITL